MRSITICVHDNASPTTRTTYNPLGKALPSIRTTCIWPATGTPSYNTFIRRPSMSYNSTRTLPSGLYVVLLAQRYERGSVMLTSNLPFSKGERIFKDPITTAAAIDCLVHHSVILELNLPSYRLEQSKNRLQGQLNKQQQEGS